MFRGVVQAVMAYSPGAIAVVGARPARQRQAAVETDGVDARVVLEEKLAAIDHRHHAAHHPASRVRRSSSLAC